MELRINLLAEATGHAHEAQYVQRHKGYKETDNPEPEGSFTPGFVQLEAKRLRPPVGHTREAAKHHAADDHVMEVRNQEQTVVQDEVRARYRQQNAGHTADREGHDKADGPHHCGMEDNTALIHGEQPVEDLHPGRDGDNHGGDTEEGVNVRARAHREEVVQPNDKRQYGNTDGRPNQRGIAEQTFTREGRCDFGEYPEDRQNQNVHFRMAPGPNQVDVHHHVAAHIVGKEMGAQIAIQGQQRDGNRQNRERGDDQYVGAQRGPGKDRHLEHCHTRRTHLQDRHEEVDTG
ncbi:hypothetical protein NGUA15_04842 [Salmonella enterica]|nr:hypothetical protein NGUA15_04842 [Salmonella enterica]